MYKIFKPIFIAIVLLASVSSPVLAQYNSDGGNQIPSGNGEVYGINVDKGESATVFPGNCGFIDSVTLKAKNPIKGSVTVTSYQTTNPAKETKGLGSKILEYCGLEFTGFSASDVETSIFNTKAKKDDLTKNDIKSDDARLFQYNQGSKKWEELQTVKKSESSVNFFYESDSANQYTYFAFGQKTSKFSIGYIPLVICGVLLFLAVIIFLIAASSSRRSQTTRDSSSSSNSRRRQ